MTTINSNKNMSAQQTTTREAIERDPKSSNEQEQSDSDESVFSEDFNDIGGRSAQVNMVDISEDKRIQEKDLSEGKYQCVMLVGELFNDDDDDDDSVVFWEDAKEIKTIIRWGVCDLFGNDGICADDTAIALGFGTKTKNVTISMKILSTTRKFTELLV